MVLRSEFVLKEVESKEEISNDDTIQIIDESTIKNDAEYDEIFNKMEVISNDENQQNYNENIIKKRKIVKVKK